MRREHVFPSIDSVLTQSQKSPAVSFVSLPPFQFPTQPCGRCRRYEPYMWAYSLPADLRRQRRRTFEYEDVEMVDAREPSLVQTGDLMECSDDGQSTAPTTITKNISVLFDDTPPSDSASLTVESMYTSPVGLWGCVKCFFRRFVIRLRRGFKPTQSPLPSSPC